MVNIFGIELAEGLFYTLIIAGAIFYSFMLWFILQILRKKMPIRVFKLGLGVSMSEFKGHEDDLKVYWKEGFYGKIHECLKATKGRIRPVWGRSTKNFLVREDFNFTIPFAKGSYKLEDIDLCNKCLEIVSKEENEDKEIDLNKLCNNCLNKIHIVESQPLLKYLKSKELSQTILDKIEKLLPSAITVNFLTTDELKGSSTEAVTKRRNEDFVDTAGKVLRKIAKGDMLLWILMGMSGGSMLTFLILTASGVLQFV